jgi:hypothetical protein
MYPLAIDEQINNVAQIETRSLYLFLCSYPFHCLSLNACANRKIDLRGVNP